MFLQEEARRAKEAASDDTEDDSAENAEDQFYVKRNVQRADSSVSPPRDDSDDDFGDSVHMQDDGCFNNEDSARFAHSPARDHGVDSQTSPPQQDLAVDDINDLAVDIETAPVQPVAARPVDFIPDIAVDIQTAPVQPVAARPGGDNPDIAVDIQTVPVQLVAACPGGDNPGPDIAVVTKTVLGEEDVLPQNEGACSDTTMDCSGDMKDAEDLGTPLESSAQDLGKDM